MSGDEDNVDIVAAAAAADPEAGDADGPTLPERAPGRPRRPLSLYSYILVVGVLVAAVVALAVVVIVDNGRSDTMVEGDGLPPVADN
jgi:hypothetical protein